MTDIVRFLFLAILAAAVFTLSVCDQSFYGPRRISAHEIEQRLENIRDRASLKQPPPLKELLNELYWKNTQTSIANESNVPEYREDQTNQDYGDDSREEKRFSEFLGGKKRFSGFLGEENKRYSEFPGGKKRFSEFLGGRK